MGLLTILKKMKQKEKEMRILMLGLDNAGKTTILKKFNGEDIDTISPTLGFNIKTVEHRGFKLNIWDVGGQKSLRSYWRNYFESTDGLIWVVDSADKRRMEDCIKELQLLLVEERLAGATLLVFANKQDLPGSLSAEEISEVLELDSIKTHHWSIFPCSAVTGANLLDGVLVIPLYPNTMNFSELFKQSGGLCSFSPDGKYVATCVSYKLIVRDITTLQILRLYTCIDIVQQVSWSSDSAFLLCAMYKRGVVQVWSIEQPDWTCKVDEGSAGLIRAQWSPDGRHILTTASFNLRITVWSLVNKSVSYIRFVKNSKDCLSFSKDGRYLALGENRKCKDYVSIFAVDSWQMVKIFETDTEDMASLEWSPDGRVLYVADNMLWYKILIYTMDGRCLATYKAYEWALGVKRVAWSPTSQFLAVGSYDQKVRVLNHITWKSISEFPHTPTVQGNGVVIYKETEKRPVLPSGEEEGSNVIPTLVSTQSKYELCEQPVDLPFAPPNSDKPNPKIGPVWIEFSPDNKYLATVDDSMRTSVFIWSMQKLSLFVVLQQISPIKCLKWDPKSCRLALCTGNDKVYLWSPSGSVSVQVPVGSAFHTHTMAWHPDGNSLLLMSKDQMCVCYMEAAS